MFPRAPDRRGACHPAGTVVSHLSAVARRRCRKGISGAEPRTSTTRPSGDPGARWRRVIQRQRRGTGPAHRCTRQKNDNPKKLKASGAEQRHLFVWLDGDTRFDIARPLSREAPAWGGEGFGTPSKAPVLDAAITHLWVVHQESRFGWLWDGVTWRELRDL